VKIPLRILIIEDVQTDAELALRQLKRSGLDCVARRVETEPDFRRELEQFAPHVILSDFTMPNFDGMAALAIARETLRDIPFIFVSGTIGEEYAINALKNGATDYVLKNNIVRLSAAIERALQDTQERAARQRTEAELEQVRSHLQSIVSSLQDVLWSVGVPAGEVLYVSPSAEKLYGRRPEEFYSSPHSWIEMVHPEDLGWVLQQWEKALQTGVFDCEYRIRVPGHEVRWVHSRGQAVRGPDNEVVRMDGIARDVTERHEHERKIAHLSRIHAVLSAINSAMLRIRDRGDLFSEACRVAVQEGAFTMAWVGVIDPATKEGRPVAWAGKEDAYLRRVRLTTRPDTPVSKEPPSRALRELTPVICNDIESDPDMGELREEALARGYRSLAALPIVADLRPIAVLVLYAGEKDFFDHGEMKLLNQLAADISFAVQYIDREERLQYLAYYDTLTGLANRNLYRDRLEQRLEQAKRREHGKLAVVLLDVDRFRYINDTLGRKAGDRLLRQVAQRLEQLLPHRDAIARVNADCFACTFADLSEAELGRFLHEQLLPALAQPMQLDGEELRLSFRAGAAMYPEDGADADALMRNAEAALNTAKRRNEEFLFYWPDMNARVAGNLALENKLRLALEQGQFILHYQPKFELKSGRIVGLEALMRWNDPEIGLVQPFAFIPMLEETGLILRAGAWALEQAVTDYREVLSHLPDPPRIAVNVSPLQLRQKDFVAEVAAAVGQSGGAHGLDLEITESVLMENIEGTVGKLQAIRDLGAHIAIDDFGTGYSSLAYISRLPVTTLKIDRSFVKDICHSDEDRNIVSSIISLAHSLDLVLVAEGVETDGQRRMLHGMGCDQLQGHLIGRPVPIRELEPMLRGIPA
jgi:diguanylate cyclase (GGDEF)-like protein/PAS domain S-box-containing protein